MVCINNECSKGEDCCNGVDDDGDNLIDCKDPECRGKECPNGKICCQDESDCGSLSSECKPYKPYCTDSKTCDCRKSCRQNSECVETACCTDDPNGPKTGEEACKPEGTIIPSGGKSYLCDPPGWSINEEKQEAFSKKSFFDLIANFFFNIFS